MSHDHEWVHQKRVWGTLIVVALIVILTMVKC